MVCVAHPASIRLKRILDCQLLMRQGHSFDYAQDRLALVSCRWQDANGTQGRDGLATIVNRLLIFEGQARRIVWRFFGYLDIVRVGLVYRSGADSYESAVFSQLFDISRPAVAHSRSQAAD
jgi:hypothetical protein